jgi:hypothetical protein
LHLSEKEVVNILICRLQPWQAIGLAKNLKAMGQRVHSIDHGQIEVYRASGEFKSCHTWGHVEMPEEYLKDQFRGIIKEHGIELVIIAQKLFKYSNAAESVCQELGIKHLFTEYFFDNKLIFDDRGLQYTRVNQSIGKCDLPIDFPLADREEQPDDLSLEDLRARYNIREGQKVVVIYGQVLWDMSLIESQSGMTYDEYMEGLCNSNPDTTFLFKPHPKDHYGVNNTSKYRFPNMKRANESLRTLFQLPAHTAFSSTVIFEGVMQGKSFASVGYHLLQHHTHRLERGGFGDIYEKIVAYRPDMEAVSKAVSYITNIYALPMSDPFVCRRLMGGLNQWDREDVLAQKKV